YHQDRGLRQPARTGLAPVNEKTHPPRRRVFRYSRIATINYWQVAVIEDSRRLRLAESGAMRWATLRCAARWAPTSPKANALIRAECEAWRSRFGVPLSSSFC